MRFFSDNAAPVCPQVMEAIVAANSLDTAYDGDAWSAKLDAAMSGVFGTKCTVLWIPTGTAANAIALASLCPPYGGIVCHRDAHIECDEAGAPEFYTHGAKLMTVDGEGAKLTVEGIDEYLSGIRKDVHRVQPHAISITNATEYGLVYTPDEVKAIGDYAHKRDLGLHMDGARFANAVATLGCDPGDVTWRAGVDVLSFGFVKNGGMSAETIIYFRNDLAEAARVRRKRGGHLLSKGRYLAAQILAMLDGDLWLDNARRANAAAQMLASVAEARLLHPVQANELFVKLTADEAQTLRDAGFDFYDWGPDLARFVISWDQDEAAVKPLADAIAAL